MSSKKHARDKNQKKSRKRQAHEAEMSQAYADLTDALAKVKAMETENKKLKEESDVGFVNQIARSMIGLFLEEQMLHQTKETVLKVSYAERSADRKFYDPKRKYISTACTLESPSGATLLLICGVNGEYNGTVEVCLNDTKTYGCHPPYRSTIGEMAWGCRSEFDELLKALDGSPACREQLMFTLFSILFMEKEKINKDDRPPITAKCAHLTPYAFSKIRTAMTILDETSDDEKVTQGTLLKFVDFHEKREKAIL